MWHRDQKVLSLDRRTVTRVSTMLYIEMVRLSLWNESYIELVERQLS